MDEQKDENKDEDEDEDEDKVRCEKLTDVCRRINIHPTHSQGSRMRTFNCCKIKRFPIFENRKQIQKHSDVETTVNVFFRGINHCEIRRI